MPAPVLELALGEVGQHVHERVPQLARQPVREAPRARAELDDLHALGRLSRVRNASITRAYAAATHGLSTASCGISANASLARSS